MKLPSKTRDPKFCHHKASGRAFVVLNGRFHYLGRYDDPRSKIAYHRVLADWEAGERKPFAASKTYDQETKPRQRSIADIADRFLNHAETYYRRLDGKPSKELANYRLSLGRLTKLYGNIPALKFGPLLLKALRKQMIQQQKSRTYINNTVMRIKHVFKWAVSEELIPGRVHTRLQAVKGLEYGRTEARETDDVQPAPASHIAAIEPYVSPQVWAIVQLQLLTAARPGELVVMRPVDLDTTGAIWLYRPQIHKTAYRGHKRTIYVGPRAQEVIKPFLVQRPVDQYLFSPRQAEAERYARCDSHRRPNQKPNPRKTDRRLGIHYSPVTYRRAILYACERAAVPHWTPYQLRHNAATNVRREFGLEGAQVILGHKRCDVTEVYAEVNHTKALEIAGMVG